MSEAFWLGAERCPVAEGELRLLSAREVLEARREGEALAADGRERALCANACLIAKALERKGKPVYPDGQGCWTACGWRTSSACPTGGPGSTGR